MNSRMDKVFDFLERVGVLRAFDVKRALVCMLRGHEFGSPHPRYLRSCKRCGVTEKPGYDVMHAGGARGDGEEGDWRDAWNQVAPVAPGCDCPDHDHNKRPGSAPD